MAKEKKLKMLMKDEQEVLEEEAADAATGEKRELILKTLV